MRTPCLIIDYTSYSVLYTVGYLNSTVHRYNRRDTKEKPEEWLVTVLTSDLGKFSGAGTDADVYVAITGEEFGHVIVYGFKLSINDNYRS